MVFLSLYIMLSSEECNESCVSFYSSIFQKLGLKNQMCRNFECMMFFCLIFTKLKSNLNIFDSINCLPPDIRTKIGINLSNLNAMGTMVKSSLNSLERFKNKKQKDDTELKINFWSYLCVKIKEKLVLI